MANIANEVILNCSFSGLTVDTVKWTRNGKDIKHNFNKAWSAVSLNIRSRDKVSGEFKCIAKRGHALCSCSANPRKFKLKNRLNLFNTHSKYFAVSG